MHPRVRKVIGVDGNPFTTLVSLRTMKLLSSILLLLSITANVEARRGIISSQSSLTSIPHRGGKQRAFVNNRNKNHASTTDVKQVRGGGGGTATMSNEMFNMVKAVVGVGVLSLPAGKFVHIDTTKEARREI